MTLLKSFPVGVTTRRSAFNQDVRAVVPKEGLHGDFLAYWLLANESNVLSLVDQAGHGTGRLATDQLSDLPVSFPHDINEQDRIVRWLDLWSCSENLITRLIAAKRRLKRGLMQQVLTGRQRFKGFHDDWQLVQLKEVTEECEERNRGRMGTASVMAVTKAEGIVPMRERTIAADIDRYSVVNKDCFAYNPMRLNIGSIARWSKDQDILVSPDYVVFRCKSRLEKAPPSCGFPRPVPAAPACGNVSSCRLAAAAFVSGFTSQTSEP